jgi:hypothetical protein
MRSRASSFTACTAPNRFTFFLPAIFLPDLHVAIACTAPNMQ